MKTKLLLIGILVLTLSLGLKAETIANQITSFNHLSITTTNLAKMLDFYKNVIEFVQD